MQRVSIRYPLLFYSGTPFDLPQKLYQSEVRQVHRHLYSPEYLQVAQFLERGQRWMSNRDILDLGVVHRALPVQIIKQRQRHFFAYSGPKHNVRQLEWRELVNQPSLLTRTERGVIPSEITRF